MIARQLSNFKGFVNHNWVSHKHASPKLLVLLKPLSDTFKFYLYKK